ncbi:hypothetical protein ACKUB1_17780 [Methanospirillum stamsii]|uniref:Uncharacterized protein n=1 Tax=Methanospirillum stamsii TaxID=1277351 RepID=A0A2V2NAJ5_9EURY|nr:hypothetical protein [Methanospirillum stamsii]PWR73347.1 hypothetical protein DLD82_10800 [Methanospirillum stamsii]
MSNDAVIETIQNYITSPEGSVWFMNAVDAAVKAKEEEKARIKANMFTRDTMEDVKRDWQKAEEEQKNAIESQRVTLTLSRQTLNRVHQDPKGDYQPYITPDNRIEFYNHNIPGNPVDLKWVNLGVSLQNITDGILIHDRFCKPCYFRITFTD